MRVLLIRDVRGLGRKNEIKDVSDGYARNYLFIKKLAVLATAEIEKTANKEAKKKKAEHERLGQELKMESKRLTNEELVFHLKTDGKKGVFGSVTETDIEKALQDRGYKHFKVELERPIRLLGTFEAEVNFGEGIRTTVKIKVCGM